MYLTTPVERGKMERVNYRLDFVSSQVGYLVKLALKDTRLP
jgi:hypothetical protein